jgi:hypothetical protein
MQQGRGGMGSHKHAVSGHRSPSPAYKQQRSREANRLAEEEQAKKPKAKTYASFEELRKDRR